MARRLLLLAALAAASVALTACDNPAANLLSSAQPGQCYKVVGKNNLGQPKLVHADCAEAGAVTAPAAAPAVQTAQACLPAQPVRPSPPPCAPAASAYSAPRAAGRGSRFARIFRRGHTANAHRAERVYARGEDHRYVGNGEYVPKSGEVLPREAYDYARPTTELAGGYAYRREDNYASAPPLPPMPPPVVHRQERAYESGDYEARSYSSELSSSSRYTSSSSQIRRRPCNCRRDGHPVVQRYERDGYLTWPGKSPF